jgi:hypothetical protein
MSPRAQRSGDEGLSSEVWLQVLELRALATGSRARRSSESITTLSLYLSCFFCFFLLVQSDTLMMWAAPQLLSVASF